MERFAAWLDPESEPAGQRLAGAARPERDGRRRLVRGRPRRVSREKWDWLPEAHTDFIYAVVGEELGILGSLLVLGAVRRDRHRRPAPGPHYHRPLRAHGVRGRGRVAAHPGAAQHRRGARLIPITGVPLPLVSYGGSSLIPTLVALGMLMSFARAEAGASLRPAAPAPPGGVTVHVVLAGGGTAGPRRARAQHRRLPPPPRPRLRHHAPRHRARPRDPAGARSAATTCAWSRPRRCRAGRRATSLRLPSAVKRSVREVRAVLERHRRRRARRFRRLRRAAGLPRRARPRAAS